MASKTVSNTSKLPAQKSLFLKDLKTLIACHFAGIGNSAGNDSTKRRASPTSRSVGPIRMWRTRSSASSRIRRTTQKPSSAEYCCRRDRAARSRSPASSIATRHTAQARKSLVRTAPTIDAVPLLRKKSGKSALAANESSKRPGKKRIHVRPILMLYPCAERPAA